MNLIPWPYRWLAVAALAAALVGFGLVGFGCSNIVPILFSAAGQQKAMPSGPAISAISTGVPPTPAPRARG